MTDTVATLKQQLLDLKADHARGAVSDGQFEARRAALEKSLLDAVLQEGGEAPATEGRGKAGKRAKAGKPVAAASAKPAGSSMGAVEARPSRKLVLLLVTGVVVLASAGYAWKGSPEWLGPGARERVAAAAAASGEGHAIGKEEFLGMIQKLADRLKEQPDNVEGWVMLGRSYTVVGQFPDALKAYERAVALRPDDAQVLADYADSMAVNNNMTLAGEPMKWVRKALQVDPNNLKALALAGTDAFIRKDYAGAVKYWQHLIDIGPPDSEYVREMAAGLKEARELGGLPATAAKATSGATPAAGAKTVSGVVSLAPALAKSAAPDDTVFILARPSAGRGMPVAILRKNVRDLPIQFSLDDSSSMSPAATLSGAGTVVIEARISKSGNAMRQSGDLAGQSEQVPVGASGLKIEIRDVVKP
jgi:cytochrome c-type biogenesis protein CcmH